MIKSWLKKSIIVITISVFVLAAGLYLSRLDALIWYVWHSYTAKADEHAFGLKDYQVSIDGLKIEGIANASGLTFNDHTNTLFTVLNKESQVLELDLNGQVLRTIDVKGVADLEGITFVDDNDYILADERDGRLLLISIADDTVAVDATAAPSLIIDEYVYGNKNFEGVTWDEGQGRLIVVKERDPKFVLAITGFVDAIRNAPINIKIKKLHQYQRAIDTAMHDLSSATYHSWSNHLFLLSDESRLIKEFDEEGNTVGVIALWKGLHGLKASVPQAEGIAIDANNNIYVMSEPNLFYKFEKK